VLAHLHTSDPLHATHTKHTHRTDVVACDAASIFNARRYAGAVFAVVVCPSVRPCVTSRYCIETTGRIELIFGAEASFHLSYTVLQGKLGISKIGYFLWNFVPNSGQRIFATASRSGCQQNSSSSSTVELVDDTYTTVDESWLLTTSRLTVTL